MELLPVSGLRSMGLRGRLLGLLRLPVALLMAFRVVWRFRPELAVSCGGYAAGPAVLMARLLGIPCVVLEQNAIAGTTNRILGHLATRIIAALPMEGFSGEKVAVLGNPVRAGLLEVRERRYVPAERRRLLVFGGSQGARALNEAMMELAPMLVAEGVPLTVVHQTGEADLKRVGEAYRSAGLEEALVVPFIDDMAGAYASADLILCRAGATTIAEVTVCGRPMIMVPFPGAVDDHQTKNAKAVEEKGGGICLPQSELCAAGLMALLRELIGDGTKLMTMASSARALGKPQAGVDIADALEKEVKRVS